MKKAVYKFILLLLIALGISWSIYVSTSPVEEITDQAVSTAQHWVSYQLPLGLPSLSFHW